MGIFGELLRQKSEIIDLSPIKQDMASQKFTYSFELEMNCDPKTLFPLFSTADGLSQWFCDKATQIDDSTFDLIWNRKSHIAKNQIKKKGTTSRLSFLPDEGETETTELPYVEFSIEKGHLDESLYLRITDYSKNTDKEALAKLWEELSEYLYEAIDTSETSDNSLS